MPRVPLGTCQGPRLLEFLQALQGLSHPEGRLGTEPHWTIGLPVGVYQLRESASQVCPKGGNNRGQGGHGPGREGGRLSHRERNKALSGVTTAVETVTQSNGVAAVGPGAPDPTRLQRLPPETAGDHSGLKLGWAGQSKPGGWQRAHVQGRGVRAYTPLRGENRKRRA